MINGASNYRTLYKPNEMTAGGAAGVLTVDKASEGDAFGSLNNQESGFQFGVWARPADTGPFLVHTRILGPFSGLTPADGQSMGLFVGAGDQDNYAKMVVSGTGGGQIAFHTEIGGAVGSVISTPVALPAQATSISMSGSIRLAVRSRRMLGWVRRCRESTNSAGGHAECSERLVHDPASGLAIGIISTSRGPSPEFPATWDFIRAIPNTAGPGTTVVYRVNAGGLAVSGTPNWSDDTGSPPSSHVSANDREQRLHDLLGGRFEPSVHSGRNAAVRPHKRTV